jgi:hypothetical protein
MKLLAALFVAWTIAGILIGWSILALTRPAAGGQCCAYRGSDTACIPCRPTRGT